ncbi:MAG: hypothetical protein GTO41_13250, partial [Burkholderiales bacterium]|nr:hypothetical protein [Burkholderiales bacterium]
YCTMVFLEVDYTPLPAKIEDTRTVGSQILRLRRLSPRTVTQTAPLWFLDAELLTDYALTHFAFPAADGGGAGTTKWQRRLMRLLRTELDMESMTLKATGFDLRHYLLTFWDIGQSKISAAANADGIARLSPGSTRTFSRSSKAWIPDPGDGRIVQVAEDEEKLGEDGEILEAAASNYVKNSAFKDGVASNWSAIASGTVAAETTDVLYDTDVTAQACKVSGNSGDGLQQTATNTVADNVLFFSYDFKGDAHDWDLQESGGNWWNDSTKSWGGSRPGNSQAASSTAYTRVTSEVITTPGASKTIAVQFRLTGSTTEIKVGHVQIEQGRWASSRIVTSGSTVTRSADSLKMSNNSGARVFPAGLGTLLVEVVPSWSSGNLATGDGKVIASVEYDANNYDQFMYWPTTGVWLMKRVIATSDYYATKTATATAGTSVKLGFRWISDEGEHGLTNYAISVFVDGTKGTDGLPGGAPTPPGSMDMYIGKNSAATWHFDGAIRRMEITPQALSDEEIARF